MEALSHLDPEVFAQLCRPGAVILFIYRDLLPDNEEYECGVITRDDADYFEVLWRVLCSSSGCTNMTFHDWYTRGKRPDMAWKKLSDRRGKIFDSIDDNCDLGWSSTPVSR